MLLLKERVEVVEYCKKMISAGLTKGTGGNISIFNREKGLYAMSPVEWITILCSRKMWLL